MPERQRDDGDEREDRTAGERSHGVAQVAPRRPRGPRTPRPSRLSSFARSTTAEREPRPTQRFFARDAGALVERRVLLEVELQLLVQIAFERAPAKQGASGGIADRPAWSSSLSPYASTRERSALLVEAQGEARQRLGVLSGHFPIATEWTRLHRSWTHARRVRHSPRRQRLSGALRHQ